MSGQLSREELEAAMRYCRVDDQSEADTLTACVLAAREYLAGAGVSLPERDAPRRALYDLVCHALALSAYDRREMTVPGTIVSENPVLRRSLTQLKRTEPVSNLDTGGSGRAVASSADGPKRGRAEAPKGAADQSETEGSRAS